MGRMHEKGNVHSEKVFKLETRTKRVKFMSGMF